MTVATNAALAIPELLRLIFDGCTRRDNCSNALVSKKWSSEALSVVWYRVDSLWPLLSLLAPLKLMMDENGDRRYRFRRPIQPTNWAVFLKYSWRIHELQCVRQRFEYCDSVPNCIGSSSPVPILLPNLRCFYYLGGSIPLLRLLMQGTSITDFLFRIDFTIWKLSQISNVLFDLPTMAPKLEVLHLYLSLLSEPDAAIDIGLGEMLQGFPRLKALVLPPSLLPPPLLHALSRLPNLTSLCTNKAAYDGYRFTDVIAPSLQNDEGFPSLTSLELDSCSFENATSILKAYKPDKLTNLMVDSLARELEEAYTYLFSVASTYCLKLEQVRFSNRSRNGHPSRAPEQRDPSPSSLFYPLFQCSNLTSLKIHDCISLYLDLVTIVALVKALPKLRILLLEEESIAPPTLHISSLVVLAPLCPRMERLTLYMDTSVITPPPDPKCEPEPFQNLQVLGVGLSPLLSSARTVASILSAVLPKECALSYTYDERLSRDIAQAKYDKWEPVIAELQPEGQGSD